MRLRCLCGLLLGIGCVGSNVEMFDVDRFGNGMPLRETHELALSQGAGFVSVYALDWSREPDTIDITYGIWTPSSGFSQRRKFGSGSSRFFGSVSGFSGGAIVDGLDELRRRPLRIATPDGLASFGGNEIAVVCDTPEAKFRASHFEGVSNLFIQHGGACIRGGCGTFALISSEFDGGSACPLRGLDVPLEQDGFVTQRFFVHPSLRVAGYAGLSFVEWDQRGVVVRTSQDDQGFDLGQFWPSPARPPTRLRYVFDGGDSSTSRSDFSNGRVSLSVWLPDGGVMQEHPVFVPLVEWVSWMRELPTGVVVDGRRSVAPTAPLLDRSIALLVNHEATKVLGQFRTRSDGWPLAPNIYVEGQYFLARTSLQQGTDVDPRNFSSVEFIPIELVPIE
jgi:hypothetical protein